MERQQEYVLRTVEERGVRTVQLWFTDILGTPKVIDINPVELETAMEAGLVFDGSAIDGFSRSVESDVLAKPDPTSFQLLPWPDNDPTGRVFCDIQHLDGTPFTGDSRWVLRRVLDRASEMDLQFYVAPELEFFYLNSADPTNLQPLDTSSYFDLTVRDKGWVMRKEAVHALEDMGVPVEYSQHEDAPSQHEIDLRHTDALTMADNVVTARQVVKEVASRHGHYATFMPKPLTGVQGSGMHIHLSLSKGGESAFADSEDELGLSAMARSFTAGLLHHGPEMTALTNQWVNSYKRLVPGHEAPVYVTWARSNTAAMIRVPRAKSPESTRIEYRVPDGACNPYLTFAVLLAAGLDGVAKEMELPPGADAELQAIQREHRARPGTPLSALGPHAESGLELLPDGLARAVERLEGSELAAETLGEHVLEWFIRNKRDESQAYKRSVSQFELDRYLPRL